MAITLKMSAEVVFARVAPGVVTLGSFILVGRYLDAADYGFFSTTLATIALITLVFTGPIRYSVVPRRAKYEVVGEEVAFERGALSLLLFAVIILGCLGLVLWFVNIVEMAWLVLIVSSALFGGWLPVLRARQQFWRYGFTALTNAIATIFCIYLFVSVNPTPLSALWSYGIGNALGFFVGWVACGVPLPGRVGRSQLGVMLGLGSSLTLSNLSENGLFLGARYVVLWLGSSEFLGLFTYVIDLAQRSVGVIINILAFAVVPQAYKKTIFEGARAMYAFLNKAVLKGVFFSLAILFAIFLLDALGWLGLLLGREIPMSFFFPISIAVITNRLKKMAIDPVAVDLRLHAVIPLAYLVTTPFAIGSIAWLAKLGLEKEIVLAYTFSYVCVAAITGAVICRKKSKGSALW